MQQLVLPTFLTKCLVVRIVQPTCTDPYDNNLAIIICFSDFQTLEDQLFSDNLLRLWRTGAEEELYSSIEDGDIDVRQMHVYIIIMTVHVRLYTDFGLHVHA